MFLKMIIYNVIFSLTVLKLTIFFFQHKCVKSYSPAHSTIFVYCVTLPMSRGIHFMNKSQIRKIIISISISRRTLFFAHLIIFFAIFSLLISILVFAVLIL